MKETGTNHEQEYTAQEVADRIAIDPDAPSRIFLSVSPCRSGTTVLLRVFGASGVQAHFQELKNVLRWLMEKGDFRWTLPPTDSGTIVLKETLGPFTCTEATFNPLEVLLLAGVPRERLHLIAIGRDPLHTWASWNCFWEGKTDVERFILAYQQTEKIRLLAIEEAIPYTCLVFEAFRENSPETVFRSLFGRLGLAYSPLTIGGWENLPGFGAPGSNIVLPKEPQRFITPHIHEPVEKATHFSYRSREADVCGLEEHDMARIIEEGLIDVHENWVKICAANLGIDVAPIERVL